MNQRYRNLKLRASIIQTTREFFISRGFLEIETPLRIPANAPEEYIDPCPTGSQYLQTSPEICMKRLLCRGYDRIFQISRCWRSNERGSTHLPEFTMLEWYRADSDYNDLMTDCQDLLAFVTHNCAPQKGLSFRGVPLAPETMAERITVREAFQRYSDREMFSAVDDGSFDECMVTQIEPALRQEKAVFLMDYPAEMAALARLKPDDTTLAERFELYLGGLELANGFSELNNPTEQRERFTIANRHRIKTGTGQLPMPEPFLDELAQMPPSAGIALGMDRLVMLFADAERIDDVVAFTPEEL